MTTFLKILFFQYQVDNVDTVAATFAALMCWIIVILLILISIQL